MEYFLEVRSSNFRIQVIDVLAMFVKAVGNVQAIVFKSGAEFPPHGLPYMGVTFKQ